MHGFHFIGNHSSALFALYGFERGVALKLLYNSDRLESFSNEVLAKLASISAPETSKYYDKQKS